MVGKKKIIFITQSHVTQRDVDRFGATYFISKNYPVEIWDISRLVRRKSTGENSSLPIVTVYHSWKSFEYGLKQLRREHVFFMLYLNLTIRSLPLFYYLGKYEFETLINTSNIPLSFESTSTSNLQKKLWSSIRIFQMWGLSLEPWLNLLLRKSIHLLKIKPPTYVLCGGKKSLPQDNYLSQGKVIWGQHLDLEVARFNSNNIPTELINEEFAVFLDNGTPFHTDNFTYGKEIPKQSLPENYYPSVNRLLSGIERDLKTKIVIAAHPRWNFKSMPNPYEGRSIYGGITPSLVKHAKFVIAHHSTALTYAVIFKKPVIFIQSSGHYPHIVEPAAKLFGKSSYPPNEDPSFPPEELLINDQRYLTIMENFLSTRVDNKKSNWELIEEVL